MVRRGDSIINVPQHSPKSLQKRQADPYRDCKLPVSYTAMAATAISNYDSYRRQDDGICQQ